VLPFDWSHVDAACVLPPMTAAREAMTGSPDPVGPEAFAAYLGRELDRTVAEGGLLTLILHPFMLEWLGEDRLDALLGRLAAAARSEELAVAPMAEIAGRLLAESG
jgi:hypothetical protein